MWATYVALISTYVDIRIDVPGLKDYVHRQKKSSMGRRFFLHENDAFPSQDKRNTRDKAKGLCVSSERHIGELGVRCLSTLNRVQDSQQSLIRRDRPMKASPVCSVLRLGVG